ncbi:hypothetical protein KCP78_21605 [Salmonella enterica subsp. enterica]|nr:hypothetical protein KCP78_21605 [Salmonella enterica subsp. enterica]
MTVPADVNGVRLVLMAAKRGFDATQAHDVEASGIIRRRQIMTGGTTDGGSVRQGGKQNDAETSDFIIDTILSERRLLDSADDSAATNNHQR